MKKFLILTFSFFCSQMFSQFTLKNHNDNSTINNGDVITFNQLGYPGGNMYVDIYNNTSSVIYMHSQCTGLVNTTGANFQYCVGNTCYNSVYVGQNCPANPFTIPANGKNGNFDGFLNANAGDGVNYPCDYTFKFFQTDASGNQIGSEVSMTYRYQSTLTTEDFNTLQNFGIELHNTIVEYQLTFISNKDNLSINIFDLSGKKVMSKIIENGQNSVDLSNLSSGLYQVLFSNENNQIFTTKIIKK